MTRRTGSKRRNRRRGKVQMYTPQPVATAKARRKLRSEHVTYGVIGALVLACCGFGAYRYSNDKDCVDPNSLQVIDRSYCRAGGHGRWYYGGHSSGIGSKVSGGSFERGGFGSRFSGGS